MAVFNMQRPPVGSYGDKPKQKPSGGISAPAPPPIPHLTPAPTTSPTAPDYTSGIAGSSRAQKYNPYSQSTTPAITPQQPLTTNYGAGGAPASSPSYGVPAAPSPNYGMPAQTTQPTNRSAPMSGNFGPPSQTTQPIGSGMQMSGNFGPTQTTQPTGNRLSMSGNFNQGGALASALAQRQQSFNNNMNQTNQPSQRQNNLSTLLQMLR